MGLAIINIIVGLANIFVILTAQAGIIHYIFGVGCLLIGISMLIGLTVKE